MTAVYIFGNDIHWKMLEKNISKICVNPDIFILTNEEPKLKCKKWEKPNFTLSKESYKTGSFIEEYINYNISKMKGETEYSKTIIYYSNTLYLPFSNEEKGIIVPYELAKYGTYMPSCRIVSHNYVFTDKMTSIHDLSPEYRKLLFDYYFDNKVYDFEYFKPNDKDFNEKTPVFLIPSLIHVKKDRTLFDSKERLDQTVFQLKNIKEKLPEAKIYLLEVSPVNLYELFELSKYTDTVILFNTDKVAIHFGYIDPNKNKTEVYLLLKTIPLFLDSNIGWICKFGGRYHFSDYFNPSLFFSKNPSFRLNPCCWDGRPIIETILYSIPKLYLDSFLKILENVLNTLNLKYSDVEHEIYNSLQLFGIEINDLNILGVEGYYASGQYNIV